MGKNFNQTLSLSGKLASFLTRKEGHYSPSSSRIQEKHICFMTNQGSVNKINLVKF